MQTFCSCFALLLVLWRRPAKHIIINIQLFIVYVRKLSNRWPENCPLIGQGWSRDLNTGLCLVIVTVTQDRAIDLDSSPDTGPAFSLSRFHSNPVPGHLSQLPCGMRIWHISEFSSGHPLLQSHFFPRMSVFYVHFSHISYTRSDASWNGNK